MPEHPDTLIWVAGVEPALGKQGICNCPLGKNFLLPIGFGCGIFRLLELSG